MSEKNCVTCVNRLLPKHSEKCEPCNDFTGRPNWEPCLETTPVPDKAKELADEHWSYVKSVLDTHVTNAGIIGEIGFHYKTAFVHGYKHGKEDS